MADAAGTGATMADWERLDIRVGTVRRAEPNTGARDPAFALWIDLGPDIGVVQSSAKITDRYTPDDLVGRHVVVARGFGAMRVGGFRSDVLVLGVETTSGVVLLGVDDGVPDGSAVS
jgi:tRNA-binding protein